MSDQPFQKDVRWRHSSVANRSTRPSASRLLPAIIASVILVIVSSLSIRALIGSQGSNTVATNPSQHSASPVPFVPTAAPVIAAVPVASPTPACASGAVYLDAIQLHEQQGSWEAAASTATLASRLPNLCPTDQRALAQKAVSDGLEAVFAQPLPPYTDVAAHQHVVDLYLSLKRQATMANIPFPMSNIQAAARAYAIGQFLLTKVTLEDAWSAGEFTAADQALIQEYTASLYNLGYHWTKEGNSELQQIGLHVLRAAADVDKRYHVGSGLAWGELLKRLGPDENTWPAPALTPLLKIP